MYVYVCVGMEIRFFFKNKFYKFFSTYPWDLYVCMYVCMYVYSSLEVKIKYFEKGDNSLMGEKKQDMHIITHMCKESKLTNTSIIIFPSHECITHTHAHTHHLWYEE